MRRAEDDGLYTKQWVKAARRNLTFIRLEDLSSFLEACRENSDCGRLGARARGQVKLTPASKRIEVVARIKAGVHVSLNVSEANS